MKIKGLIIASNNAHKLQEIRQILGADFSEIYSLKQMNIAVDPDETGSTFYQNAKIKADAVFDCAPDGYAVLADDSGLCVDALSGAPGVNSARFAGVHGNDGENIKKLLTLLDGVENRAAHFCCSIVIKLPNGEYLSAEGKTFGKILRQAEGESGFGYDPIFYSEDLNKSFGIASSEEKNAVSHRGRALCAASEKYAAYKRSNI